MTERTYKYDPAEAFVTDAFETGDASYIARALGIVARAKGIRRIAEETGLSREQLYRSFSECGNPTLKTTLAVARALGLELTARERKTSSDSVAVS